MWVGVTDDNDKDLFQYDIKMGQKTSTLTFGWCPLESANLGIKHFDTRYLHRLVDSKVFLKVQCFSFLNSNVTQLIFKGGEAEVEDILLTH